MFTNTPRTFRNQKEIDMYFHNLENSLEYNDFLKEQSHKKSIFKRPTHNYVKTKHRRHWTKKIYATFRRLEKMWKNFTRKKIVIENRSNKQIRTPINRFRGVTNLVSDMIDEEENELDEKVNELNKLSMINSPKYTHKSMSKSSFSKSQKSPNSWKL